MNFLPYLVDAVVILIFVCVILDGRRRGFAKMVLSLIATIISILFAGELAEPIAVRINDAYIHDIIVEEIDNNFNVEEITEADIEAIEETIPDEVVGIADEADISIKETLSEALNSEGDIAENIVDSAEKSIVIPVLSIVSFAALYILLMIIFAIIIGAINTVFKLPVINRLNKALGAALGAVKGVFVISVISLAAVFGANFAPENELSQAVINSTLLNIIFDITSGFIL